MHGTTAEGTDRPLVHMFNTWDSAEGRLQMEINNKLSQSHASGQMDINLPVKYSTVSMKNNSYEPDTKYLQTTKTRYIYSRKATKT